MTGVDSAAVRVVKIGGAAIDAGADAAALWDALAALHAELRALRGGVVIVHGGGAAVDRRLGRFGLQPRRIDGLRVTGPAEIDEVVATIGGLVNAQVAAALSAAGAPAVGLGLADGGSVALACPDPDGLGRVGRPAGGDPRLLHGLLAGGWLPAIACVGRDADGFLNVNADEAAAGLAASLPAAELILLTDVPGVRGGAGGSGDVLPKLDAAEAARLEASGVISGGMVPKVRAALDVARASGRPVRIASWRDPSSIASGGTLVLPPAALIETDLAASRPSAVAAHGGAP